MLIETLVEYTVELNKEIEEQEKKEQEERERQFIGTSKMSFQEWWASKEKERDKIINQIKKRKEAEAERKKGRLTGKQFFMNSKRRISNEAEDMREADINNKLKDQGVDLDVFTNDLLNDI